MALLTEEQLLEGLQWRYATKQFDPFQKIPEPTWETLEQVLVLTPSSFGLQPWRFLVVKTPALRERLRLASWGQRQLVEASHLVVFTVRKTNTEEDVDAYIDVLARESNQSKDSRSLQGLRKVVLEFERHYSDAEWNARQAYIALGTFMTSAALLGIDTCPLEGINIAQYDEILGLVDEGYTTAMICLAGYRSATDKYASQPKVRFSRKEIIHEK